MQQKKQRPGARPDEQHRATGKTAGDTESKPSREKQDNAGEGRKPGARNAKKS